MGVVIVRIHRAIKREILPSLIFINMIRLKDLLHEVSLDQLKTQFADTGKITNAEFVEIIDSTSSKSAYPIWLIKHVDILKESVTDKIFSSKDTKKDKNIVSHKIINIKSFTNPSDKKKISLKSFHFILGENSLSIFEAFQTDEIAGLQKEDCIKFLKKHKNEKKDAFIAGLTNVYDGKLFIFFNMDRIQNLTKERIVPHECLHLTRYLLTIMENKDIDFKDKNWWKKTKFVNLTDNNEELFSEVLERCTYIVFDQLHKYFK